MLTPGTTSRFSAWPRHSEEEIAAVERVLRTGKVNYWTGSECREFEAEYADYVGVPHAIAVANGTVALELALRAVGVGPGDEVIVPCRTFIASASAIVAVGATPVVCDIDADTQNLTADTVAARLSKRTRAVVAVHLGGRPCEMSGLLSIAQERGLRVIEDCAQAHGARYRGHAVGSLGDAAAFSFCQDKILSTGGEGGMLTTRDDQVWRRAWSYKDHGKCHDAVHAPAAKPGFRWLHRSFGTNWRMTEMQGAIGRIQLRQLDSWVDRRRANAARIESACQRSGALRTLREADHLHSAAYRCYAFAADEAARDQFLRDVQSAGVPTFTGSCGEIYREEAFRDLRPREPFPVAKELAETSLAWLVDPTLTDEQIAATCDAIVAAGHRLIGDQAA